MYLLSKFVEALNNNSESKAQAQVSNILVCGCGEKAWMKRKGREAGLGRVLRKISAGSSRAGAFVISRPLKPYHLGLVDSSFFLSAVLLVVK